MKKQTGKAKRGLAMLLCASIVISVTPGPVMAEENFTSEEAWTENPQTEEVITFEDETTEENWITEEADTDEQEEELFIENIENFESGNEENTQIIGDTMAPIQAGAEENDSEIAVQANDSAGKTEQQSTDEAIVYQPAVKTTDKYDIDDDGTKDTVYEISNAGQLYWFAGLVNGTLDGVEQNTLANAVLTANITVNENLLDSLQYDTEGHVSNGSDFITWTPIADWMGNRTTQY